MVGFVALDEILGFFFGGMVGIAFEVYIGNDFLHDSTANATCFRIPFDVIAALERPGHLRIAIEPEMHPARQWSGGKRYPGRLQHHEEFRVLALAFDRPRARRIALMY